MKKVIRKKRSNPAESQAYTVIKVIIIKFNKPEINLKIDIDHKLKFLVYN